MAIKIDKGIPLAPIERMIYPFRKMAVGDSFWLPATDGLVRKLHGRATTYRKKLRGFKIRVRPEKEGGAPNGRAGYRIWRTA